jgi:signal transduction histidine kinase/FixJ family two-component response regulator
VIMALLQTDTITIIGLNSVLNVVVLWVLTVVLWRQSLPMGRPQMLLATVPFALILGLYLLRLGVVLVFPGEQVLTILTLGLAFLLTFSVLQWCFSLMAFSTVRLTRSLSAERRRAEEANRMKSQFLANMSHEVRTPLNGVLGMAQILEGRISDPTAQEMLTTIRQSGEELLSVLNDILDLSKVEAGKLELDPGPFVPAALLSRIDRLYRPRTQDKGISLIVDRGPGLDAMRLGDDRRIMQVLHNLLSNAVKFTERGAVRVEARWIDAVGDTLLPPSIGNMPGGKGWGGTGTGGTAPGRDRDAAWEGRVVSVPSGASTRMIARASPDPGRTRKRLITGDSAKDRNGHGALELVVIDSGIGMTPDQLDRIFEDFVQADGGITRRFGGTGLGLSIARRIVDLMGGRIEVDSQPGVGTRFRVLLPLRGGATRPDLPPVPRDPGAPQDPPPDPPPGAPLVALSPDDGAGPCESPVAARPSDDGAAPEPYERQRAAAEDLTDALQGLRVLMAEDNLTNQRVVSGMLAGTGVKLTIVETGTAAVEAVTAVAARGQPSYDLLLLDVSMPQMDGPTALRLLMSQAAQQGDPPPRAIALTANVMAHQVATYRADGFIDHLGKPVRRADLLAMLRRHAPLAGAAQNWPAASDDARPMDPGVGRWPGPRPLRGDEVQVRAREVASDAP